MVLARWSRLRVSQLAFCRHSARKSLLRLVLGAPGHLGEIDLVDQHARQGLGIELDRPAAVGGLAAPRHRPRSCRHDRRQRRRPGRGSSARISASMSSRSSSSTPQMRLSALEIAPRQQFEIVHQRLPWPGRAGRARQAGCAGIRRGRGQTGRAGRTSGSVASTSSDVGAIDAKPLGDLAQVGPEIAGLVEPVGKFRRDQPLDRVGEGKGDLLADMVAQRDGGRRHVLHVEAVGQRRPSPLPDGGLPLRGKIGADALDCVPGSSGNRFSSEVSSFSDIASALQPASPSNQSSLAAATPRRRLGSWAADRLAASSGASARSSSGLRSISSSMKRSSSIWVNCSSRIDCISCGVITSDCDCRSCSLADSAMADSDPIPFRRGRKPAHMLAPIKLARLLLVKQIGAFALLTPRANCGNVARRPQLSYAAQNRSEGKALAEIEAAHIGIGDDLVGASMRQHLAGMDDVGAVDQAERLAHIVVGDQHADAARGQVPHELLDVGNRNRVDAGEGLVEQHVGWAGWRARGRSRDGAARRPKGRSTAPCAGG